MAVWLFANMRYKHSLKWPFCDITRVTDTFSRLVTKLTGFFEEADQIALFINGICCSSFCAKNSKYAKLAIGPFKIRAHLVLLHRRHVDQRAQLSLTHSCRKDAKDKLLLTPAIFSLITPSPLFPSPQVAVKIIDKTQLNPTSLQKVSRGCMATWQH